MSKMIPQEILLAVTQLLNSYVPGISPEKLEMILNLQSPSEHKIQRKLTRRECADLLGVSLNSIHRYINAGRLKTVHISPRLVRIDPNSVQELLNNGMEAVNE